MAREVMNVQQVILLTDVLRLQCAKQDDMAVYKDGWDDAAVLRYVTENNKTGRPFNMNHVVHTRQSMFGPLRKLPKDAGTIKEMESRIEKLEEVVDSLMQWRFHLEGPDAPVPLLNGRGRPGRPHSTPPSGER